MSDWIKNEGKDTSPLVREIMVDIKFVNGEILHHQSSVGWTWSLSANKRDYEIAEYRLCDGWEVNTGEMPVPEGTLVDTVHKDGEICTGNHAGSVWLEPPNIYSTATWELFDGDECIAYWRLHEVAEPEVRIEKTNPKQIHGQSNLPLSLFSPLATAYGSLGKLNGKLKYGLSNFLATPVIASIYVDAIRRHLDKWMAGEDCDSADGVPHFAAILANVDILICAKAAGTLVDDRPLSLNYFEEIEKLTPIVKALHELHKDKTPKHYLLSERDGAE